MKKITTKLPKTKKCDYCKKRKKTKDMYWIGRTPHEPLNVADKVYWICDECNLEKDIV